MKKKFLILAISFIIALELFFCFVYDFLYFIDIVKALVLQSGYASIWAYGVLIVKPFYDLCLLSIVGFIVFLVCRTDIDALFEKLFTRDKEQIQMKQQAKKQAQIEKTKAKLEQLEQESKDK